MNYKRFEDLPVWNSAVDFAAGTFTMTASGSLNQYAGFKNQIERAAVSVSNNIAEGYERGTHEELLTVLYYALRSAGEVRSMLLLLQRLPGGEAASQDTNELLAVARSVSRQLNAWIESLKNSGNRSPRYQNDPTRSAQKERTARQRIPGTARTHQGPGEERHPAGSRVALIGHRSSTNFTRTPDPCARHRPRA